MGTESRMLVAGRVKIGSCYLVGLEFKVLPDEEEFWRQVVRVVLT
jgi:hypothetical protein